MPEDSHFVPDDFSEPILVVWVWEQQTSLSEKKSLTGMTMYQMK